MTRVLATLAVVVTLTQLGACGGAARQEQEEAAQNTYGCGTGGERIVIRFDRGEARLLMPGGERVNLYQVPSGAGVRYTNGTIDLFGRGTDLRLARDGGAPEVLQGCALVAPPK